jgi:hypothetical protein
MGGDRIVLLNVRLRCIAGRSAAQAKLASEFLVPDGFKRAHIALQHDVDECAGR